jgi:hypothetical protein
MAIKTVRLDQVRQRLPMHHFGHLLLERPFEGFLCALAHSKACQLRFRIAP